jgi:hypothetical protein
MIIFHAECVSRGVFCDIFFGTLSRRDKSSRQILDQQKREMFGRDKHAVNFAPFSQISLADIRLAAY